MQRRRTPRQWLWISVGASFLLVLYVLWYNHAWQRNRSVEATSFDNTRTDSGSRGFQFKHANFCDEVLNSGGWIGESLVSCEATTKGVATCGQGHDNNWQWSSEALRCGAHRLAVKDLTALLQGKWVAVVGDSVGRFFYAAMLRMLSTDGKHQIVLGHRDFEYTLAAGIRASFYWAPYAQNATTLLRNWTGHQTRPDALVFSIGLWHMLHVTSAPDFTQDLQSLKSAASTFIAWHDQAGIAAPSMSLCSITETYPPKMRAEDKRQRMTQDNVDAYNMALAYSKLLVPRGPMYLLDIHHLTQGCGAQCTGDGVHYSNATYDAALQIWGNNLHNLMLIPTSSG